MNLELKHLAPYLPYRLKIGFESDEHNHDLVGLESSLNGVILISLFGDFGWACFDKCKPILRPLSDLTKEIEVNGERFVPIEKLQSVFSKRLRFDEDGFYNHDEISMVNRGGDKIFTFNQLDAYSFLFKWHFDVFGLIPAGLAIDINTIDQCTKQSS